MAINVTCDCGRKLQVRDEFAGREGKCPACGETFLIPLPEGSDEPLPAARLVEVASTAREEEEEDTRGSGAEPEPLQDHGGGPIPGKADFFVAAPEEVGELLSASTTLKEGQEPTPLATRLLGILGLGLVGLAVGVTIDVGFGIDTLFLQLLWPGVGILLGAGVTYALTGFSHTCTYVGREGVAHYVCSGRRDHLSTADVFRFRDAAEVRTASTIHYYNGAYTHTSYSFTWSDVGGRTRYTISGQHKKKDGVPPTTDFYHFGRAAEIAWSNYLLRQALRQIDLSGSVQFNLSGNKWVRLGPGVVILGLTREPEECPAADLAVCSIQQGVVCIRRRDAKEGWFSSKGVYKFNFAELANAQLFFYLLEQVVGIPVQ